MTRFGRAALVLALGCIAIGVALNYRELILVGIAPLVVVIVAALWMVARPRLRAERVVRPNRVVEGDAASAMLTVTNMARRRSPAMVALETFGDSAVSVSVPSLEAGGSHSRPYRLPTDRRGGFKVGPLTVSRSDPFHLMRTGQEQKSTETLWVHPATHIVSPFPNGTTRDLEGPTSGEAPQGGIAFHTLREYVVGDDLRLIHWKSSAKVDRLMVRHNVDTYQPRTLVIFDVNAAVYEGDSFEEAVRVVASLMVANAKNNFPIRLRTTAGLVLGSETGDQIDRILDHLAAIKVNKNASLSKLAPQVATERAGFSLAVITGQAGVAELAAIGPLRARFSNVTIGRVGVRGRGGVFELPGAVLINAGTSGEFAQAWNRRIRR
ncbi:MAG: DUF58 domain-containing protein [Acidimicrobiales bacterium]|nr:DUF58 domain-containing protein [Acidimicrobiales bacterium]